MKKKVLSALSLSLVFVMLFAMTATLVSCGGSDGTYYLYTGGDACSKEAYIKISGSKWENQAGASGKCTIDGDKITLSYKLDADKQEDAVIIAMGGGKDGDTIELLAGTIENGKLTIKTSAGYALGSDEEVYYLDGKVK